ncbi:flagellar hook assembly protein FlgD [Falsibacillus albus]|uniref:Basal-body rod modification protein FlgD n=1 Tax=Falsibacillus albus TaxID=2478915 RepID=A0A3L7K1A2_9BACI|nr:flagellar hook assembly protein FlgD [Falsibacillus albus]RLQ95741.1 flagellar hook assembly protein FlgD [Falsibacillus albus]
MTNSINSNLMLSSYQNNAKKTGNDVLGKDDFMKILMTQLQNQDPTNPLQDKDFIAQMATFSSLEQMTNMNQSLEKFVQTEQQSQLMQFNQFVGKQVHWHKLQESADPNADPIVTEGTGKVKSIQFKEDTVDLILDDGTVLSPANVSEVTDTSSQENPLIQASYLIGKNISYLDGEQMVSAMVKSVSLKDGKLMFTSEDGKQIEAKKITSIE